MMEWGGRDWHSFFFCKLFLVCITHGTWFSACCTGAGAVERKEGGNKKLNVRVDRFASFWCISGLKWPWNLWPFCNILSEENVSSSTLQAKFMGGEWKIKLHIGNSNFTMQKSLPCIHACIHPSIPIISVVSEYILLLSNSHFSMDFNITLFLFSCK